MKRLVVAVICLGVAMAGCKKSGPAVTYTQIDTANGATISGTIHYNGKPPAPVEIDMAQDPACSMSGANMTEQYVVNHGGLANVFVYVKDGLGNKVYPVTRTPVVIDQKGCRFVPHVAGAMVGSMCRRDRTRGRIRGSFMRLS
jgi:hypothetical protein